MNNFQITEVVSADTIKVSPNWKFELRDGSVITGERIKIRGLDTSKKENLIEERLKKLLINSDIQINFNSPELVDTEEHNNAIVSCSVYLADSNILYYFPEFVYKG